MKKRSSQHSKYHDLHTDRLLSRHTVLCPGTDKRSAVSRFTMYWPCHTDAWKKAICLMLPDDWIVQGGHSVKNYHGDTLLRRLGSSATGSWESIPTGYQDHWLPPDDFLWDIAENFLRCVFLANSLIFFGGSALGIQLVFSGDFLFRTKYQDML